MNNPYDIFEEVISVDKHIANLKGNVTDICLRGQTNNKLCLFTPSGKLISIVHKHIGNGPEFIVCKKLPDAQIPLPADGWSIKAGKLLIPGYEELDFSNASQYDSYEKSEITDFPGHMENTINSILRENQTEEEVELKIKLLKLAAALKMYSPTTVEPHLLQIIGLGEDKLTIGDTSLCAMLLTGHCFYVGKRFQVGWFKRFAMEIRALLHRTNNVGRNWLNYALESRTTQIQQNFFTAMAKDFEYKDELAVKELLENKLFNGRAFLIGVSIVLEMIRERFL